MTAALAAANDPLAADPALRRLAGMTVEQRALTALAGSP
jgi:hypothetical protein